MLDGQLLEMENKRKCQISDFKSGCSCIRNLGIGRLGESFWNSIWLRQSGYLESGCIREVVAYESWPLWES